MRIRISAFMTALVSSEALACPTCATSASAGAGGDSVWLLTGAFLVVPPLLAGAAFVLLRPLLRPEKDEASEITTRES
jgi:hypothetical protein